MNNQKLKLNEIPFIITAKYKILRDEYFLKYMKDVCVENYGTLRREIRKDLNKWKDKMFMRLKSQYC